jgi:hypothetical protein
MVVKIHIVVICVMTSTYTMQCLISTEEHNVDQLNVCHRYSCTCTAFIYPEFQYARCVQ